MVATKFSVTIGIVMVSMLLLSACGGGSANTFNHQQTVSLVANAPRTGIFMPPPIASSITWNQSSVVVNAGANGFASVKCPAQMLGGGYSIAGGAGNYTPTASYPSSISSWTVILYNSTITPLTVTAYAGCLNSKTNVAIVRLAAIDQAKCPPGAIATGGGFDRGGTFSTLNFDEGPGPGVLSGAIPVNSWETSIPMGTVKMYVLCAQMHVTSYPVVASPPLVVGPGHSIDTESIACPAGQLLSDGGFEIFDPEFLPSNYFESLPSLDGAKWIVGAEADAGSFGENVDAIADCITIG